MENLQMEYKGYDDRMQCTSFILGMEVPENHFKTVEASDARIQVQVPNNSEEEVMIALVSRQTGYKGRITHWKAEESLSEAELALITQWIQEQDLRQHADELAKTFAQYQESFLLLTSGADTAEGVDNQKELMKVLLQMESLKQIQVS